MITINDYTTLYLGVWRVDLKHQLQIPKLGTCSVLYFGLWLRFGNSHLHVSKHLFMVETSVKLGIGLVPNLLPQLFRS